VSLRGQPNYTTFPSPLPSVASASADQFPLELRQAAQDRQHQPAVRLVVSAHVSLSDLKPAPRSDSDSVIFRRSRVDRAVEAAHYQHVAVFQLADDLGELYAVALGAARLLPIAHSAAINSATGALKS
jgi:hypothetical protein